MILSYPYELSASLVAITKLNPGRAVAFWCQIRLDQLGQRRKNTITPCGLAPLKEFGLKSRLSLLKDA